MPRRSAGLGLQLLLLNRLLALQVGLLDGCRRNVALPQLWLACGSSSSSQQLPLDSKGSPLPRRRHSLGCCQPALRQLPLRSSALLLPGSLLPGRQRLFPVRRLGYASPDAGASDELCCPAPARRGSIRNSGEPVRW